MLFKSLWLEMNYCWVEKKKNPPESSLNPLQVMEVRDGPLLSILFTGQSSTCF